MKSTKSACLGATLLLAAMMVRAATAVPCPPKQPPYPPQSPRIVNPHSWPGVYNGDRPASFVTPISTEEIKLKGQPLYLCDQHFHIPVENPQCSGESPRPPCGDEQTIRDRERPALWQWIEVHTVYAAKRSNDCRGRLGLDNDLECCKEAGLPVVVRGFSALVTADNGNVTGGGNRNVPFIPPVGSPLAEWSGSNTGPDKPNEPCKEIPAQWSFLLNRALTVGRAQLHDKKPHGARGVQSDDRLSRDLALVMSLPRCRWESAGPIRNENEASSICQPACQRLGLQWNLQWYTRRNPTDPAKPSNCSCCPGSSSR